MMTSSYPTPDISHLTSADYDHVYEPAEDSFLFLDALENDLPFFKQIRPQMCVEVGCGSGVVSTFLAQMLGGDCTYICTDINRRALEVTQRTGAQNNVHLNCIQTDLVSGLLPALTHYVDVLMFNPPYVVTPAEEVGSGDLSSSWAGGVDGRRVIDQFLPYVTELLSLSGVLYLVVIKENKPDELCSMMSLLGFDMSIILSRRSGPEFLSVLKFKRKTSAT